MIFHNLIKIDKEEVDGHNKWKSRVLIKNSTQALFPSFPYSSTDTCNVIEIPYLDYIFNLVHPSTWKLVFELFQRTQRYKQN